MFNYLKNVVSPRLGKEINIEYHIPENKSHGLEAVIDDLTAAAPARKYDLVILPDSSSNDYDYHHQLKELGYDILVIDHHEASRYSEDAVVINNQLSENYPNKALSGVGVVYKFWEYWEAQEGWDDRPIGDYVDVVALGEVSDMVNMNTLENRYICKYGLSHIKNEFFQDLIDKQSFSLGSGPLTQIGVAFYITPLINALIRMGSTSEKEKLFLSFITPNVRIPSTKRGHAAGDTESYSEQTIRNCVNAKSHQDREKEKALELLSIQISDNCLDDNKILILNADDLNVSTTLTGLCAMAVAAAYKKPVILGRMSADGYLRGSMRGREESELKDFKAFLEDSRLTDYVEGHANASGVSIKSSNISKLYEYANEHLANINFNEGFYEADFVVNGNCSYLAKLIAELDEGKDIFGQGCKEPVIIIENIPLKQKDIQVIGQRKDTLKFVFNGITYIKFRASELIEQLKESGSDLLITIAGRGNINTWMGHSTPQVLIDEIEIKETNDDDF